MAWAGKWSLGALLAVALGSAAAAERVTVFAAASLKTALDDLKPEILAATDHELRLVFAGSSTLARQIEQGAPADIFISANVGWMDHLQERGKIDAASRLDLLANSLVFIGREAEPDLNFEDAASFGEGRIAMGLTQAVPAGIYGREALTSLGLWEALKAQVVETDNVRAALALVAMGEARYGVVYGSDAVAEPKVQVLLGFPSESHSPIVYPAALVGGSEAAAEVLTFLQSDTAWSVLGAQGFIKLEAAAE
ncbi:molybdate ABC transporter substrate-binding protein [Lentibacter sp. XHP0401]|uniref:molybdate ABC transporter substrate-binding protein n=1 Tax=Lentibacter sp. XHP0401 TaxID=2984334 RepID=UPI0021E845AC|nr:molybdate ABC transporter substrate-binding protein [Lentibacter sp. XHP0401]MCV2894178.1 molybdate ABC transporter substrate-binding protein [Lentibacter sp. XHP0401]